MDKKELLNFLENHCLHSCPCSYENTHDTYCHMCEIWQEILKLRMETRIKL